MKIFYNRNFTGHYPVGVSAVIFAGDADEATELLNLTLRQEHALEGDAKVGDMVEIDPTIQRAYVLGNGDY